VQITRVNFPNSPAGRDRKIAYVEFGDEEAMKAGLEKHVEVRLLFLPFVIDRNLLTVCYLRN
jgi:hypothetical protein